MKKLIGHARKKLATLARSTLLKRKSSDSQKGIDAEQSTTGVEKQETLPPPNVDAAPVDPVQPVRKPGTRSKKPRWTLEEFQVTPKKGQVRFHDFDLPLTVMHGIADEQFEYCTPIQAKALPLVLDGGDLVGKANTGTGKSAVFLVAIFSRLLNNRKRSGKNGAPRALIIAPTRELVIQIAKDGRKLGKYTNLRIEPVYGGANYEKQMDTLRHKPVDIMVATPGRLLDFANKRVISFGDCNIMVIDEGDRMLDMGFIPDVRRIISRIPSKEERQTLLFSATVSDDVKRLAYQWCVKPQYVEAESDQVAVDVIDQRVYLVTTEEKYPVLYNLIRQQSDDKIMVFANMKSEVRKLSERLNRDGIECVLLSGDVPQTKREKRLERFRSGKVKVLVATDVAGRGIHIEGISFVVNYSLPFEPEDYVHRIGRTGRAGASGVSVSFACEEGAFYLPDIEEYIGRSLPCSPPTDELLQPVPESKKPTQAMKRKPGNSRPRGRRRKPHTSKQQKPESKAG
ncbi:DEAD/DEAH box helicase [Desulfopila sp. IMCC35008]|uniref:DEAD/DEAH box helicase n=1 Tax=Desulfopila sp. IMCC35008 TaxID=2653858 RepID=UPI0013D160CC|nr:DEAD/DEAH box helicase [Desulfopila sp. IMCC35008]